jgi:2-oxoglutarate ferredoxin oxidoreductase subunit gamma
MRGGTANASVIVSESEIGSPVVDFPNVLIAMNGPSMDAFEDKVKEGGTIIVNSSIISDEVSRKDVKAYYIPASDIASQVGLLAGANIVILTLYLLVSKVVDVETLRSIIPLSIKKEQYVEKNLMMVDKAIEYYEKNYKS